MSTKDVSDQQVLEAYEKCRLTRPREFYPYDLLQEWTGQPFKVCYRAMERAAKRGLLDYGVSLRTGWITDKGKEILKGAK